jgi:hypothetical protein
MRLAELLEPLQQLRSFAAILDFLFGLVEENVKFTINLK